MPDVFTVLDFLSRFFAVLLAIGSILGFVFRKWIGAWIDARFKRQVDAELESVKYRFSSALEEKKNALAKQSTAELEQLKAKLAQDLEVSKRKLDEEFRRKSSQFDKTSLFYETFHVQFGDVISKLYAIHFLDTKQPVLELWPTLRPAHVIEATQLLSKANSEIALHGGYLDNPELSVRTATLYADLSRYIADGTHDRARLDKLALQKGKIGAELQYRLVHEGP